MMRRRHFFWAAALLAVGCLTTPGTSQAQGLDGPAPPVSAGMLPVPPTGPAHAHTHAHHGHAAGCSDCERGPLGRAVHHVLFTIKDRFIGYPDQFVEPPLGYYLSEHRNTMRAKADPHDFFLYHTDFIRKDTVLSPTGAQRLTLIANRLPGWLGPIVVEWTPEEPALAEERKAAILAALTDAGMNIDPDRILIGPSPYPGLIGDVAEGYYPVLINRSIQAPATYSLPPMPPLGTSGGMGGSAGFGGGGLR